MWFPVFILGSFWFFILFCAACIVLLLSVESDMPGLATLTTFGFFLLLWLFGDFNILKWIGSNPVRTLMCAASYFLIGAVWSICKWWFFVRKLRDKYNEAKLNFIVRHGLDVNSPIPESFRIEFSSETRYYYSKPSVRDNKSRIMTWMAYWPWSCVWSIINDPIKKVFKMIYHRLQRVYQSIADKAWEGVE